MNPISNAITNPPSSEIEQLQNTIDNLTNEIHDLQDKLRNLGVDYDYAKNQAIQANDNLRITESNYSKKIADLNSKLAHSERSLQTLNSYISTENFKTNRLVTEAEKEQKRIQDNCNHLNDIVKTQAETIKLAHKKIEEHKYNENHLAQKLVKLHSDYTSVCNELTTLKNSPPVSPNEELTKLKKENTQLNKELLKLKTDNVFQESDYIKYKTFVSSIKSRCTNIHNSNLINKPKLTLELLSFIFTTITNSFSNL